MRKVGVKLVPCKNIVLAFDSGQGYAALASFLDVCYLVVAVLSAISGIHVAAPKLGQSE